MTGQICYACREPLTEPGGMLLGPPDEAAQGDAWPLCVRCYPHVASLVKTVRYVGGPPSEGEATE
jgi:hypothetical protein